jgi:hypothetical protein
LVDIDMFDARVGIRTSQHFPDQQTRQGDVSTELRPSSDFIDGIDLRRLTSNDPKELRSSLHTILPRHTAFAAGETAKWFGALPPLVRFGNRQLNSGYHTIALHAIAMRGSNQAACERRGRSVVGSDNRVIGANLDDLPTGRPGVSQFALMRLGFVFGTPVRWRLK